MADHTDPFASIDFDAIIQAANRQKETLSPPDVVKAVEEETDLFKKRFAKKFWALSKRCLTLRLYYSV